MIVYLWELNRRFKAWVKRNGWKGLVIEFSIGLSLALGIYFIGDYFYERKLKEGKQCYTKTVYIGIDKSNYLDNIHFKFVTYLGDTILSRDKNTQVWELSKFDLSKTYTVKYLYNNPKYKELILEDWDESKYIKDDKGCYFLKDE
jgi:hypothetical protein